MPEIKRTIKDSVFTYLFSQPEYARELYLNLHPEDQDVTEEDIKLMLVNGYPAPTPEVSPPAAPVPSPADDSR